MSRKRKEMDIDSVMNLISEIEHDLLFTLEIGVNNNVCTSEGSPIIIDGKPILYPKGSFEDSFNNIKFDPFWNRKLTNYLFQRYIKIFQQENGVYVMSFFLANDLPKSPMTFAVCRTKEYGDIQSNRFINETVCWIDLIYKLEKCQYSYEEFLEIDEYITFVRNMEV